RPDSAAALCASAARLLSDRRTAGTHTPAGHADGRGCGMSAGCETETHEAISDINMTPLVDVMLVLLIIFIITVPVLTQTVRVELPNTTGTAASEPPAAIVVSVAADGTYYWDAEPLDDAGLRARLAMLAQQQAAPNLHLHGDRQVPYEHVMQVMAA